MRTAALSGYLDRIMEGQYDTLMQHDTGSELEDSMWVLMVYIVLVLLVINGIYMLASKKIRDDVIVEAIKDDTV